MNLRKESMCPHEYPRYNLTIYRQEWITACDAANSTLSGMAVGDYTTMTRVVNQA
jgi:hypothetical protein